MANPQQEERQAKALELHLAGATYEAIANAVGYASKGAAHKSVQAALDAGDVPVSAGLVATELARLDAMLTGIWPKARRGDLQAIDRVLRISERRVLLAALDLQANPVEETNDVDDLAAKRQSRRAAVPSDVSATGRKLGAGSDSTGG